MEEEEQQLREREREVVGVWRGCSRQASEKLSQLTVTTLSLPIFSTRRVSLLGPKEKTCCWREGKEMTRLSHSAVRDGDIMI